MDQLDYQCYLLIVSEFLAETIKVNNIFSRLTIDNKNITQIQMKQI